MRFIGAALLFACSLTAVLAAPAELSEVQKLKAKSYIERRSSLPARYEYEKAQAIEAVTKKYQQEAVELESERQALEAEFRLMLTAAPNETFDWSSLTFKVKSVPSTARGK